MKTTGFQIILNRDLEHNLLQLGYCTVFLYIVNSI